MEKNNKITKNSFFNSTFTDSNGQSSNVTNKNSVHEHADIMMNRKLSKPNSLNDPKKTPQHRRLQSCLSKESDGTSYQKEAEASILMNETFVVNDSRENTDYVKKICSAVEKDTKGVYLSYQTPDNLSIVEPERKDDLNTKVKSEYLKSTTKKAEMTQIKAATPFFSLRKAAKNSFFDYNRSPQEEQKTEILFEDDQISKRPHQRLLFSPVEIGDSQNAAQVSNKRAFRKVLSSEDQENRDINIINEQYYPHSQFDSIARTPIPKEITSYGLVPTHGITHQNKGKPKRIEEGQVADEEVYSTPNRPRNSPAVSTLSDKKLGKNGDFSFNGKIEEVFTTGNIQTTSDSESMKITPRLNNMLAGITPEIKTLLLPGERLYTVEEVGTPSRELSTLGEGNSHFKSFNSRKSQRKNHNTSMRMKNSDVNKFLTLVYYNI